MGNLLTDNSGNVLLSGGNALEVTSSIDSNITPGNIKKDVTILGVTGTYEGSGGFRCTNKLILHQEPVIFANPSQTYLYTFDGELDSAALTMLYLGDGGMERILVCETNASSGTVIHGGTTITASDFMFQDKFTEPYYSTENKRKMISHRLTFTNQYTNSYFEINDTGTLNIYNQYTMAFTIPPYIVMVIFKGKDGTYDFDIIAPYLGEND